MNYTEYVDGLLHKLREAEAARRLKELEQAAQNYVYHNAFAKLGEVSVRGTHGRWPRYTVKLNVLHLHGMPDWDSCMAGELNLSKQWSWNQDMSYVYVTFALRTRAGIGTVAELEKAADLFVEDEHRLDFPSVEQKGDLFYVHFGVMYDYVPDEEDLLEGLALDEHWTIEQGYGAITVEYDFSRVESSKVVHRDACGMCNRYRDGQWVSSSSFHKY
ncbi:MAG: hypothetical protein ACXABY_36650 [Candidatus Thorarchaeota archaeon]|jgi:hypothetical protein